MDEYLKEIKKREEKPPHLGQIHSYILHAIDCVVSPFFLLPKRIRGVMAFILTSQYRFIPLDEKSTRRPKPFPDPLFPMALHLLKIRAAVSPDLLPHYTSWSAALVSSHELGSPHAPAPRRKRRRRR